MIPNSNSSIFLEELDINEEQSRCVRLVGQGCVVVVPTPKHDAAPFAKSYLDRGMPLRYDSSISKSVYVQPVLTSSGLVMSKHFLNVGYVIYFYNGKFDYI